MERIEYYLQGYAVSWADKPRPQVVEEIASWSLETKRIPDPYYFIIREDAKFVSPQTGKLVEKSIRRVTPLEIIEGNAFDRIQNNSKGKNKGFSFWISPPHPERSIFTKMIISEIQQVGDERHLFNRVLMLDLDEQEALGVAIDLSRYSHERLDLQNPEELRGIPIFIDDSDTSWVSHLNIKVSDKPILEKIVNGEDIEQKELAVQQAHIIYNKLFASSGFDDNNIKAAVQEAIRVKYFGEYDGTCPPALQSAFAVMEANSFGVKTLDCNCGFCKQKVKALIHSGRIHCPACKQSAPYRC